MDEQNSERPKARLFDIRHLPMDFGRIVCSCLPAVYRLKRVTPDGKKYKRKLRYGAIVTANHKSFGDPFVVAVTFWYRRMFFLAAETVMQKPIRRALLKGIGCIKIDRNINDIEAIKKCVSVLKNGHVLSVFPQGGINGDDDVDHIKSGAVLMALQSGVPIIPTFIGERRHWYERRTVVIGEAVDPKQLVSKKFPSAAEIEHISDLLAKRMHDCKAYYLSEAKG